VNTSNISVLVVDDDLNILKFLDKALSKEGYQVDLVENGQECLSFLKKKS